jgi:hypothetical protein
MRKNKHLNFSNRWSNVKKGEKPGLWVREEYSHPRGSGFESRRILDGCKRFASYYMKRKIENKGSQMGHTKKKILKKKIFELHWPSFFTL